MNRSVFVVAIAALFSNAAHATFYVDDDAPHVTAAAPNPSASMPYQAPAPAELTLDVTFVPHHTWINPQGMKALRDNLQDLMGTDLISVTTYRHPERNFQAQRIRGTVVRDWLVKNGISANAIRLTNETTPAPNDPSGNTVTISIAKQPKAIAPPQYAAAPRFAPVQPIQAVYTQVKPVVSSPAKTPDIDDHLKLKLVSKIVAMSQNKIIKPDDAITMLAEIIKMQDGPLTPNSLSSPSQAPAVVAVEFPRTWTLDGKKTLRQNVEDWALAANWNAPVWQSTTQFSFGAAPALTGTFLDALSQLAAAIPSLDFKVSKSAKTLTVLDNGK